MIVSHGLWQREFGGDPEIIGRTVQMDDGPHIVIGIMPPGFDFPPPIDLEGQTVPLRADVWLPFGFDAATGQRGAHYWTVVGRLAPGATLAAAEAELRTVAARLEREFPASNEDWTVLVEPFRQVLVGDAQRALLVLFGAVGMVLLIGCVNIANLMLARSTGRQREYAIRAALGAGRAPLLRQALVESQLLALSGGLAGLLLSVWAVRALVSVAPRNVPRLAEVSIDPFVIAFAFIATVVTGLLFGLAPALRAFSPDLARWLRTGSRSDEGGAGYGKLRSALVISEVALSLVLLVAAALLFSSFLAIRGEDAGYSVARVLTMRTALPGATYANEERRVRAFTELEARITALPGVEAAGFARDIPLAGDFQGTGLVISGDPPPAIDEHRSVNFGIVTPGWFDAMGLRLVEGRTFGREDGPDAPRVIVVNETLVRRFFGDREAIGRGIEWGSRDGLPMVWTVIGIVGDARIETLGAEPPPVMFFPRAQGAQSWRTMGLVVRATATVEPLIAGVRTSIREYDPAIAIYDVKSMDDVVAESVAQPRFSATMLLLFSAVALLLAAVGIYGVISYDVGRRTREIGIRMALGARPGDAQWLVVARSLRLVGVGIVLGISAALALTRVLRSLLYEVSPTDPLALIGTSLLLVVVAALASWLPAMRASRVDPSGALRSE
jgi:predicted permease